MRPRIAADRPKCSPSIIEFSWASGERGRRPSRSPPVGPTEILEEALGGPITARGVSGGNVGRATFTSAPPLSHFAFLRPG